MSDKKKANNIPDTSAEAETTTVKSKGQKKSTPSFIVELPLACNSRQAKILRSRFEAARNLYNALLSEAINRLKALRNSPEWQAARSMPTKTEAEQKARQKAFTDTKAKYGFTEYALHSHLLELRVGWLEYHIDANTGQKLATRAFKAVERVGYGQARRVRFKSIGRGMDSIEGKSNVSGIRFLLGNFAKSKTKKKENKNNTTTASTTTSADNNQIQANNAHPKGYLVWDEYYVRLKPSKVKAEADKLKKKKTKQAEKLAEAEQSGSLSEDAINKKPKKEKRYINPGIGINTDEENPTHKLAPFKIPVRIDWEDKLVAYSLSHRVKFVRILRRKTTSPRARGADCKGYHYYIQLVLEGVPYKKQPKSNSPESSEVQASENNEANSWAKSTIGLDLGPQTIAIASQDGSIARLEQFCNELAPDAKAKRRLQRKLDRQRRASNPANYDERGQIKKRGNKKLTWKYSKSYQITRQRLASRERKLSEHRKSQHGKLANEIAQTGSIVKLEKIEYKTWQKMFGKSVGVRAPRKFVEMLKRTVARTGGTFLEFPTRTTKLSQVCHGCGTYTKKPLSQRWHNCKCGVGWVQRDLYSAWLASFVELAEAETKTEDTTKKSKVKAKVKQEYTLSVAQCRLIWGGVESRLVAAMDRLKQRANEGYQLPRSVGLSQRRSTSA